MYVLGWVGNTHNKLRESDRKFYGVDGRITNQSIDGLNLRRIRQSQDAEQLCGHAVAQLAVSGRPVLPGSRRPPQQMYTPQRQLPRAGRPRLDGDGSEEPLAAVLRQLRHRPRLRDGRWLRVGCRSQRTNVTYNLDNLVPFTQPTTVSNMVFVGVQEDWSPGSQFVPPLPADGQLVADRRRHGTGAAQSGRGDQLESARTRRAGRDGWHVERGR